MDLSLPLLGAHSNSGGDHASSILTLPYTQFIDLSICGQSKQWILWGGEEQLPKICEYSITSQVKI